MLKKLRKKIKRAAKAVGNFAGDIGKGTAGLVAALPNSVTGHEYNPKYRTRVGRAIGATANNGINNVHTLFKSFADGVSGGQATKQMNRLRKKENRESRGNYHEMRKLESGISIIDKGMEKLTKTSAVVGTLYGSQYAIPLPAGKPPAAILEPAIVPAASAQIAMDKQPALIPALLGLGAFLLLKR